jgi:hypothetical protein
MLTAMAKKHPPIWREIEAAETVDAARAAPAAA